jgi:hypothetical protein
MKKNRKSLIKNSKRLKKRRTSHRKINKYQIGGADDLLDKFKQSKSWDNKGKVLQKLITLLHEQTIEKSIKDITTIFIHPTAFFREEADIKEARKIKERHIYLLNFIEYAMHCEETRQSILWQYLALYISLNYMVDVKRSVKLALALYNNFTIREGGMGYPFNSFQWRVNRESYPVPDFENEVIEKVKKYILNRKDDWYITFVDNLPSGWAQHTDPASGETFYADAATGKNSQWESPATTKIHLRFRCRDDGLGHYGGDFQTEFKVDTQHFYYLKDDIIATDNIIALGLQRSPEKIRKDVYLDYKNYLIRIYPQTGTFEEFENERLKEKKGPSVLDRVWDLLK